MTTFPNYAGQSGFDLDQSLGDELLLAGITPETLPESMRTHQGEVESVTFGTLHGWTFRRLWYYWSAEGPGIPLAEAMALHQARGKEVRVDGHCGCPSPLEQFHGLGTGNYHVDTQIGLKALADTIKAVVAKAAP